MVLQYVVDDHTEAQLDYIAYWSLWLCWELTLALCPSWCIIFYDQPRVTITTVCTRVSIAGYCITDIKCLATDDDV